MLPFVSGSFPLAALAMPIIECHCASMQPTVNHCKSLLLFASKSLKASSLGWHLQYFQSCFLQKNISNGKKTFFSINFSLFVMWNENRLQPSLAVLAMTGSLNNTVYFTAGLKNGSKNWSTNCNGGQIATFLLPRKCPVLDKMCHSFELYRKTNEWVKWRRRFLTSCLPIC